MFLKALKNTKQPDTLLLINNPTRTPYPATIQSGDKAVKNLCKMITFNQLNQHPKTDPAARYYIHTDEEALSLKYWQRYKAGTVPELRRHGGATTTVKNLRYSAAAEAFRPKIAHLLRENQWYLHKFIDIPYFPHIPNPNGTPGHITVIVSADFQRGIEMQIEKPDGYYKFAKITGNIPATIENIQAAALKFFKTVYFEDTHPAAVYQKYHRCTKAEAMKIHLTAERTGYYKAHKWDGKITVQSVPAPAIDADKYIVRRLRRKLNIDASKVWDSTKLPKLLKLSRQPELMEAHDEPNIWALMDQFASEADTDEGIEQLFNEEFNQYPKNTIFI